MSDMNERRRGRRFDVPCTVEIERSFDSFHAYAVPEDVMLRPGDQVIVHGAPAVIGWHHVV
jgi:hypothetical protein